jgi:hypothetical protein
MRNYQNKARRWVSLKQIVWAFMFVLLSTTSQASDFEYPDTPIGRMFDLWFETYAEVDEPALRSFLIEHMYGEDDSDLDGGVFVGMIVLNDSGGLEPHSIMNMDEFEGTMLARGKNDQWLRVILKVTTASPHMIISEAIRRSQGPEAEAAAVINVSAETKIEVVESVAQLLREQYVYEEGGMRYSDGILNALASGTFDNSNDGMSLARLLTEQLNQIQRDQHMRVLDPSRAEVFRRRYEGDHTEPGGDSPGGDEPGAARDGGPTLEPDTGFDSAEVHENNIGYIRMSSFRSSREADARAEEIMRSMQGVDTLIFDLRTNSGGDGDMVGKLQSYLFAEPTMTSTYVRRGGALEYRGEKENWTVPNELSSTFADVPVYVLVSNFSASAAEAFPAGLRRTGRAIIIGETTAGAAHMAELLELPAGFAITLPIGGPKDPRDDFEGVGIQPDIPMPAGAELEEVLEIIRNHAAGKQK